MSLRLGILACIVAVAAAACAAAPASTSNDINGAGAPGGKTGDGAGCGDVPTAGVCDGDSMVYCFNDKVVTNRCASSQTCAIVAGVSTCVAAAGNQPADNPASTGSVGDACNGVSAKGECDSAHPSLWYYCGDDGKLAQVDCQMYGGSATCEMANGEPTCVFH